MDSQSDISTNASMLLESVRAGKILDPRQTNVNPVNTITSGRQQLKGGFSVDLVLNPSCILLTYLDRPFAFSDSRRAQTPLSDKNTSFLSLNKVMENKSAVSERFATSGLNPPQQRKFGSAPDNLIEPRAVPQKTDWLKVYESTCNGAKLRPRFWEDMTKNPNLIDVGKLLLTPSRLAQIEQKVQERYFSPWGPQVQTADQSYCLKAVQMLLLGTPGNLFELDPINEEFKVSKPTYQTSTLSSQSLRSLLSGFTRAATVFHQLRILLKLLENRDLRNKRLCKGLLVMLSEYLQHISQVVLGIPPDKTLLQVKVKLGTIFREAELIHSISMSGRKHPLVNLPSDRTMLKVLSNLCAVARDRPTTKSLCRKVLSELCASVQGIIFQIPDTGQLLESLESSYTKDRQGNFVIQNCPQLISPLMPDVFQAAQALALVQRHAPQMSALMVGWGHSGRPLLPLTQDRRQLEQAYLELEQRYKSAVTGLEEYFLSIELDRQKVLLTSLEEKVARLRQLKTEVELHQNDRQRIKQMEAFKRIQLEQFLQFQIEEKKTKELYSKQLRIESEREDILNRALKEQRQEKLKLLKEIEGLGKNIDDEIEKAAIEAALKKYQADDQAMQEEHVENLDEKVSLSQEQSSGLLAKIESDDLESVVPGSTSKIKEESIQEGAMPLIGNNLHELKELAEGARAVVLEELNNQDVITVKDSQDTTSPLKTKRFNKRMLAKTLTVSDLSSEEEDEDPDLKAAKQKYEMTKGGVGTSKQSQQSSEFEDWPTWPTPPLSVTISWWLGRVVKLQERITNKAVIGLLFQQHNLWETITHLKNVFLCKRGDIVDGFISQIFSEDSSLNRSGIIQVDYLFQAFEVRKFPELKFRLTLNQNFETFPETLSCLDKKLAEFVRVEFLLKSPLIHLLSESIINLYFNIFSYLIQVRFLHNLMSRHWMELSTRSLRKTLNLSYLESGIPTEVLTSCLTLTSTCSRILNEYSAYMYHFCIEKSWTRLRKQLFKASTFNRIFKIHKDYLDNMFRWITFGGYSSVHFRWIATFLRAVHDLSVLIQVLLKYGYHKHNSQEVQTKLVQIAKAVTQSASQVRRSMKVMMENASAVIVTDTEAGQTQIELK